MVVVGADVHKRTHTFVAVDEVGRQLGHRAFAATTDGHHAAVRWARQRFGTELVWAIEDCRHLSARLERDLLTAGQPVVRVPPKMMAEQRRIARTRGKSDPIDALAVARAALREPDLPLASHDETSRELKLLVDRRDDLVKHRTSTINRLLWRVHELDPAQAPPARSLDLAKQQRRLMSWLADRGGIVAELARDELAEIIDLTAKINDLARRIDQRVSQVAPRLLAMPVWSGNTAGRVRLTRSGNRQLNAAIHRIAVTQIRLNGLGKTYYEKKKAEGMSTPEALRCLKRRLARIVFNHLTTDQALTGTDLPAAA